MNKKKAKGTSRSKGAAKKSTTRRRSSKKKEINPLEVRKEIVEMVESQATTMAQAVIDEGKKGQLATVKYLFEVAEIYPPPADGSQSTSEEDSLAKTLLHRLHLPEEPIQHDDDDEPVTVIIPAHSAAKTEADEDENPGDEGEVEVAGVESN